MWRGGSVTDPEPSIVIDQLMQRYHYGSVASLLSEPAELINDFLEIMSIEGKLEAEERRKAVEAQRRRG